MNKQEWKQKVIEAVNVEKEELVRIADEIYANPEYGFKEFNTSAIVQKFFAKYSLPIVTELGITGCAIRANAHKKGPHIVVIGELDAVSCLNHVDATESGAIHACGHNHQIAGMLGACAGILQSGVLEVLGGSITFLAVPAEECIEIEYRDELRKQGKINYICGKQHLFSVGFFDDIDMAMMFHSQDCGAEKVVLSVQTNGFLGKKVAFQGKEAHAGGAPHKGVNALNAAVLAMNNIHAQRETFQDADWVRVHPIITKGGDLTNVVPADVRMESYIRANNIEAIASANNKFDRAVKAGAMAVGANVVITDIPGYLPMLDEAKMGMIFKSNLLELGIKIEDIRDRGTLGGSLDFGDISHILPSIHPMFGGVTGDLHAQNYTVVDKDLAYILPAKAMALTVVDLLFEDASVAKEIMANFTPALTKDEYRAYLKNADKESTYTYMEE